jgi:hypothetical protein
MPGSRRRDSLLETNGHWTLPHEEGDHARAGRWGRGEWRTPHESRQLVPWAAQEAEGIGVPPPDHVPCPARCEARDQRDVAVEVLRGREAPASAVDAEQGAGAGRRRRTRGTREAVHVQLEASRSPCPDDRRPGRIVRRRDRDSPTTTIALVDGNVGGRLARAHHLLWRGRQASVTMAPASWPTRT